MTPLIESQHHERNGWCACISEIYTYTEYIRMRNSFTQDTWDKYEATMNLASNHETLGYFGRIYHQHKHLRMTPLSLFFWYPFSVLCASPVLVWRHSTSIHKLGSVTSLHMTWLTQSPWIPMPFKLDAAQVWKALSPCAAWIIVVWNGQKLVKSRETWCNQFPRYP